MSRLLTWHLRQASLSDFNRANLLFEVFVLSKKWTQNEINPKKYPELALLPKEEDRLFSTNFENYLFESYPDEFLDRLYGQLLDLQIEILKELPHASIDTLLEPSKQQGSQFAKRRWKNLPKEISNDFIGLTLLFKQTPTYWLYPIHYPLIVRSASKELVLEFTVKIPEHTHLAKLYSYWLWGLFSEFQTDIHIETLASNLFRVRYFRSSSSFSQR